MLKEANKTFVQVGVQTKPKPKTSSNILLPIGLLGLIGLAMASVESKPVEPDTTKPFSWQIIFDPFKNSGSKFDLLIGKNLSSGLISFEYTGLKISNLNIHALSMTELESQLTRFFKDMVPDEQLSSVVKQTKAIIEQILPKDILDNLTYQDMFDAHFDTKFENEAMYMGLKGSSFPPSFPCTIYTTNPYDIELLISCWNNPKWTQLVMQIGVNNFARLIQQRILAANIHKIIDVHKTFRFIHDAENKIISLIDKHSPAHKYTFQYDKKQIAYQDNMVPLTIDQIKKLIVNNFSLTKSIQQVGITRLAREILWQCDRVNKQQGILSV